MNVPFALLALGSLLYLATVLTFVWALVEQDQWPAVWHETRRRWLKLMAYLVAIAAATQLLTVFSTVL